MAVVSVITHDEDFTFRHGNRTEIIFNEPRVHSLYLAIAFQLIKPERFKVLSGNHGCYDLIRFKPLIGFLACPLAVDIDFLIFYLDSVPTYANDSLDKITLVNGVDEYNDIPFFRVLHRNHR